MTRLFSFWPISGCFRFILTFSIHCSPSLLSNNLWRRIYRKPTHNSFAKTELFFNKFLCFIFHFVKSDNIVFIFANKCMFQIYFNILIMSIVDHIYCAITCDGVRYTVYSKGIYYVLFAKFPFHSYCRLHSIHSLWCNILILLCNNHFLLK